MQTWITLYKYKKRLRRSWTANPQGSMRERNRWHECTLQHHRPSYLLTEK